MANPKNTGAPIVKKNEDQYNPMEVGLSPDMRAIADGVGDVTLEDIEFLKDFHISDTDARIIHSADILAVKDMPNDPDIGHLVFRWLSPRGRAKRGMNLWHWVKGPLAKLVRQKGLVSETIAGGASTSVIVQGDLMLAFMPRQAHTARKSALKQRNSEELNSMMNTANAGEGMNTDYQQMSREFSMRTTHGSLEDD